MELVCPAGNLPALKAAVDNGADAVYIGLQNDTNARHFSGLNFTEHRLVQAVEYVRKQARHRYVKLFIAVNTYAQAGGFARWQRAVDIAADCGADALIAADIAVLSYAHKRHPSLNKHLSVQASATSAQALQFYHEQYGIRRAVLPRVLSLSQVATLIQQSPVDIEVFGFGSLCIMAEGRCLLSSYATSQSPNTVGACSPASAVRWDETATGFDTRLGGFLIDRFTHGEQAGYPTLCKGRFCVEGQIEHAIESPTSLNTLPILPQLLEAGVKAVKIEGRQRSPAYVAQVVGAWRTALDACLHNPQRFTPSASSMQTLAKVSEGRQTTLGAYDRPWQ